MKQTKILVIGDFNRNDFLLPFAVAKDSVSLYFLEYLSKDQIINSTYKKYGKAIFWKDFTSAYDLLEKIKPAKVFFYFIESYNHVAINAACKEAGIPTYHLEHGVRNYEVYHRVSKEKNKTKTPFTKRLNPVTISRKYKNRRFFNNTLKKSSQSLKSALQDFYEVRSAHSIVDAFKINTSRYRIADHYISFSPEIFKFHQINDHLPEDYPVTYVGVPGFDRFADLNATSEINNNLLFIDQPMPEIGELGWDQDYRKQLISQINNAILVPLKMKMFIKTHPLSDLKVWNQIARYNSQIELITDEEEFEKLITKNRIVLGFNSTLLLPLIALKHTVSFSWVSHPKQGNQSQFLTDSNAIDPVDSVESLLIKLENLDLVWKKQSEHKLAFTQKWLYAFDGKASERLTKLILS